MAPTSQLADPQVVGLPWLLSSIREGALLIPRFQRPFIWRDEQQLDLLRSILQGLPIGSILVWRTRTQVLACYDRIGRHRVEVGELGAGGVRQYVLDGFQRLSTLYNALSVEDATETEDVGPRFYLDLDSKDFVIREEPPSEPHFLPMSLLLDRIALMRIERKLDNESWIETAEEVFAAFDRFRVPIIPLVTESIEQATRAFERINQAGTRVSRLHVVHALSYGDGFDLLERSRALREEQLAPIGWNVDDDTLLATCGLSLGLPLYESTELEVAKKLREQPEALSHAVAALVRAAAFFRRQGIHQPGLVPYSRQVVLVAMALTGHHEPTDVVEQILVAWLWLTTYAELFAGISGGRFQRVHLALRRSVQTGQLEWPGWRPFSRRPLPARLDARSARAKALALRLAEATPLSWLGKPLPIDWPGVDDLREAMVQIVPRARGLSPAALACAGNRFLVPPEEVAMFRVALLHEAGPALVQPDAELRLKVLRSHVVSGPARALLEAGSFEAFVRQREADLEALEEAFIEPYRARLSQSGMPEPS